MKSTKMKLWRDYNVTGDGWAKYAQARKNRKYNYPVQLAVYSQTVEVTLYLTLPLKLNSYNHQHWLCLSVVSENKKLTFLVAL